MYREFGKAGVPAGLQQDVGGSRSRRRDVGTVSTLLMFLITGAAALRVVLRVVLGI